MLALLPNILFKVKNLVQNVVGKVVEALNEAAHYWRTVLTVTRLHIAPSSSPPSRLEATDCPIVVSTE